MRKLAGKLLGKRKLEAYEDELRFLVKNRGDFPLNNLNATAPN